jgi:hypothetical protein
MDRSLSPSTVEAVMRAAVFSVLLTVVPVAAAAHQDGGFVTAGSGSIDYLVYRETIAQISGGALWRLADDRLRVGAQVDALTSNGYWTGRGGPVVELTLGRRRTTPFLRFGRFAGEDPSWIAGGGVDFWLTEVGGVRIMLVDAFRRSEITSVFGNSSNTFSRALRSDRLDLEIRGCRPLVRGRENPGPSPAGPPDRTAHESAPGLITS